MRYEIEQNFTYLINNDGEREMLANFSAEIIEEVRYTDGIKTETVLTVEGKQQNPESMNPEEVVTLPAVEVGADEFGGMSWVMKHWGVRAVIKPGSGTKDNLRAAIQIRSKPKVTIIYRHIGWAEINGKQIYLHAGGGISATGNSKAHQVRLGNELSRYDITPEFTPKEGVNATLALLKLGPAEVMWPLIAATLTPLYGEVDFAIHLAGRTGTFKSEVMSLCQSHYGKGMDARHLPGSWSSTANALEAQAYLAKNAPFVVDDFVPAGTAYQQRAYQQNADKIIRAQGNQAGRARLTDISSLQQTMYPRGIVLSTGEDVPEGHSVRARMLILELSPGDIKAEALTVAQRERPKYTSTIAALIQHIAGEKVDLSSTIEIKRDELLEIGHTRTPAMLARLIATVQHFLSWAAEERFISDKVQARLSREAETAIVAAGSKQRVYLEEANPVDQFRAAIRQVFAAGLGHARTLGGGIPRNAPALGWVAEREGDEAPLYKSRGPTIGWVDYDDDELFIDITAGYALIKKAAGAELVLTKQTLFKRLKDDGVLKRTDEARQRNTVRVTAENHPRQVLVLSISETLDSQEVPQDGN